MLGAAHDDAIWLEPGVSNQDWAAARRLAFPPAHLGLGLPCAQRLRPAAYWATWADVLAVLHQRRPDVATRCVRKRCAARIRAGSARPRRGRLGGSAILARPPTFVALETSKKKNNKGWQRPAAAALNLQHREREVMPDLEQASQALLWSESGAQASTATPSDPRYAPARRACGSWTPCSIFPTCNARGYCCCCIALLRGHSTFCARCRHRWLMKSGQPPSRPITPRWKGTRHCASQGRPRGRATAQGWPQGQAKGPYQGGWKLKTTQPRRARPRRARGVGIYLSHP